MKTTGCFELQSCCFLDSLEVFAVVVVTAELFRTQVIAHDLDADVVNFRQLTVVIACQQLTVDRSRVVHC